jgi:ABC-2 type transport system permease protein
MRALAKLCWVEIKLFVREPLTAVFSLAFPLLVLVILGGVFGNEPDRRSVEFGGAGAMDFYVPGYLGLVMASVGLISLPLHLTNYRERGVLRRYRSSSIPPVALLGAELVVSFVIATIGGIALIALGVVAYGVHAPNDPGAEVLAFVVCTAGTVGVGILLGSLLPNARAAQAVGLLLFFISMFVSGTAAPREFMPSWMLDAGQFVPLTHVVNALQDAWIGPGANLPELAIVLGVGIVSTTLALRAYRWD